MIQKKFNFLGYKLSYLDSQAEGVGADKPIILFAHANGYSAGCYHYYYEKWQSSYRVLALDFSGHGQSEPIWTFSAGSIYRDQILALIEELQLKELIVIGHSMGGVMGILASIKAPNRIKKVIALDPVLLDPIKIILGKWINPLAKNAQKRRNEFKNIEQVRKIFPKFSAFASWDKRIFGDYLASCFRDSENGVELCCNPKLEAKNFRSMTVISYLNLFLCGIEVHIIKPRKSDVCPMFSARMVVRANRKSSILIKEDITHFFPFEKPDWTMEQINQWIKSGS